MALFLFVWLAAWIVVHHTRYGRYLYAIGENRLAAQFAAVPVRKVEWTLYAASGLVAAIVALVYAAHGGAVVPNAATGIELQTVACVVVGGTRVTGGAGGLRRTLLGVAIMSLLDIGLQFMSRKIYVPWSDVPWQLNANARHAARRRTGHRRSELERTHFGPRSVKGAEQAAISARSTMTDILQVVTTVGSQDAAAAIAQALVSQRLAACVQIVGPVTSTYHWQGQLETSQEWMCVAKTTRTHYDALAAAIRRHHTYEVPEILAFNVVNGHQPYLDWVAAELNEPPES